MDMLGWFEGIFTNTVNATKKEKVMEVVNPPLVFIEDIKPGETFILPDELSRGVLLRMVDHNGAIDHPPGTYIYVQLKDGVAGRRDGSAQGVIVNYECKRRE